MSIYQQEVNELIFLNIINKYGPTCNYRIHHFMSFIEMESTVLDGIEI